MPKATMDKYGNEMDKIPYGAEMSSFRVRR